MILKAIFVNIVDPDQTAQDSHCLLVCKNRFEKSARIFSRRHLLDAVFLGALRVKKNTESKIIRQFIITYIHLGVLIDFSIKYILHLYA